LRRHTELSIQRLKRPGLHGVGHGIYLRILPTGGRRWLFRWMRDGKARWLGLGPQWALSLAAALEEGQDLQKALGRGLDPAAYRENRHKQEQLARERRRTFREVAEDHIRTHQSAWRSRKHGKQWRSTLATYAYPVIGDVAVADVGRDHLLEILNPIWIEKAVTAGRVRGRIEAILDAAEAKGLRDGRNPAELKTLKHLLPKHRRRDSHFAALPFAEVPDFVAELQGRHGFAVLGLEFTILTAARTGEVLGARWPEIDDATATWIVPAGRMKGGREHRVPLSGRAIGILAGLAHEGRPIAADQDRQLPLFPVATGRPDGFIFAGAREGRSLSNMAMLQLLRRMGRGHECTVHGFRSAFRDWAAELTHYPPFVIEAALAHAVADKVEAAYRRGDLLERRRRLMEDWARYCMSAIAGGHNVVRMKRPPA
jgi:integrase